MIYLIQIIAFNLLYVLVYLGAYIKVKDPAWIPAVEHYLGASTFSTFCVDNSHDAKVLNAIMREIYLNERIPQIICSKFYNTVRNLIHKICVII